MKKSFTLDSAHSSLGFKVKHMMISQVRGAFEKTSGSFSYNTEDITDSKVEIVIDTASINTLQEQRDAHLKSADFLEVEKFPTITFTSKKFREVEEGIIVTGDLTIHGVTRSVDVYTESVGEEMKDPYGSFRIGFSGTAKIKRKDFGLTWNTALETGGVIVGDEVAIEFDVQFIKDV